MADVLQILTCRSNYQYLFRQPILERNKNQLLNKHYNATLLLIHTLLIIRMRVVKFPGLYLK